MRHRLLLLGVPVLAAVGSASAQCPAEVGQWEGPWNYASQLGPLPHPELAHADLRLDSGTGKVLLLRASFDNGDPSWLFDVGNPSTLATVPLGFNSNLFCSGHAKLPNGDTLVAGGTGGFAPPPLPLATSYRFTGGGWVADDAMASLRFYPTLIRLFDGRGLCIGGLDNTVGFRDDYELYDAATFPHWALGPTIPPSFTCAGSFNRLSLYPRSFLLSSGEVLVAGELPCTFLLDLDLPAPLRWSPRSSSSTVRSDGCALIFPGQEGLGPDQVAILLGGPYDPGSLAQNSVETNLDPGNPASPWLSVPVSPPMRPRIFANAVLLPDGSIFIVGGSSVTYETWHPSSPFQAVPELLPELLVRTSPTGPWSSKSLAYHSFHRLYHSVALLLPTGQVLSAGGEQFPAGHPLASGNSDLAIYDPPYLFRGPRPVITSSPDYTVAYQQYFPVLFSGVEKVDRVVLMRPGSVTHHFDSEQRLIPLTFEQTAPGALLALSPPMAPATHAAPRGDWMLFLVSNGVPSVARPFRIGW
ncbi:MAG TPA: galactose oxidase early set domain-containing protein [Planctomycetota bacterium]|jgi:hypothetical protein|nr:galactose oxidase early set domain-containing protein [Planctomycetota bacterium]